MTDTCLICNRYDSSYLKFENNILCLKCIKEHDIINFIKLKNIIEPLKLKDPTEYFCIYATDKFHECDASCFL